MEMRTLDGARVWLAAGLLAVGTPVVAGGQQVGDPVFAPDVGPPLFALGGGPRVLLDEAHHNYHTLADRYGTFGRVLRRDGFVVEPFRESFTAAGLEGADVLVIANALHAANLGDWSLPTPSAFTSHEIAVLRDWVEGGGALLLIADHMPFPGAAQDLAGAFGFHFSNGFAAEAAVGGPMVFRRSDGSLAGHAVTVGRLPSEGVDSVATFTGQALRPPSSATSLLTFRPGVISLEPDRAWEFGDDTRRIDVGGWSQGAVMEVGRGRLAVFGEAAMFTAQRQGSAARAMGMNAPVAGQNARFLVNLVRWLVGVPEGAP
jgi:hypothetical protein